MDHDAHPSIYSFIFVNGREEKEKKMNKHSMEIFQLRAVTVEVSVFAFSYSQGVPKAS